MMRKISFSPPDVTELEIQEIVDALRSGWITTGPRTKQFEKNIAAYCGVEHAVCLNSATAAMEMTRRRVSASIRLSPFSAPKGPPFPSIFITLYVV